MSVTGAALTAADIDDFNRDGFLVLPSFADGDTVAALRQGYDEILDGQVQAAGDRMLGGITRQVMVPSSSHPVFWDNGALQAGLSIARTLLGTERVVRTFDMLIFKPPGHPHSTPWHQDWAYAGMPVAPKGSEITARSLQFWVALDDADAENGCMHFVPGRHREPLLEHVVAGGDVDDPGRLLAMVDPEVHLDLSHVVCAAIPAGGATIHDFGTPHYTPPNTSTDRPRRAYIFNIGMSPV